MEDKEETPDSGSGAVSGLYRRRRLSGKQSWTFRFRFYGKQEKLTWPGELSRKEARLCAHEAIVKVAHGTNPAAEKRVQRAANRAPKADNFDRVEVVVAQFLKRNAARWKPSTRAEVPRYMKRVIAAWGGRQLSSITRPMISTVTDSIIDEGSDTAANRFLTWFSCMCNWAVQRGIIAHNPCTGMARPAAETARSRVLADDELVGAMRATAGLGEPYGAFIWLLALTGQRKSEVQNLTWDEIDLGSKTWLLPAARAKNNVEHTVPLSDAAVKVLQSVRRFTDCPYVFSVSGKGPITGITKVKKQLDAAVDIPRWVIHDIRRTVASGMARLGVQLPVVEKTLNHVGGSFAGIQGVYQRHSFADEKRAAMEMWSRHVDNLMTGQKADVVPMIRHG